MISSPSSILPGKLIKDSLSSKIFFFLLKIRRRYYILRDIEKNIATNLLNSTQGIAE